MRTNQPHHSIRRPDEVCDELAAEGKALGLGWPADIDEQVTSTLDRYAYYAQRPVEVPRHNADGAAFEAGRAAFRNPDGLCPSVSWPKPLDQQWVDGWFAGHEETEWRYEREHVKGGER